MLGFRLETNRWRNESRTRSWLGKLHSYKGLLKIHVPMNLGGDDKFHRILLELLIDPAATSKGEN